MQAITGLPDKKAKTETDPNPTVEPRHDDQFDALCEDGTDIERLARDLDVMGKPVRLRILIMLYRATNPVYFKDIADSLGIEYNSLAYHIAILKSCDLVTNTIDKGKGRNYSMYLISDEAKRILGKFLAFENGKDK